MEAKIRDVEAHELERVSVYAYQLNSIPIHKCKAFPTDYDSIFKQFARILDHSDDELLVLSDDNNIYGLLALCVEPKDMYIEAIGGVFAKCSYEVIGSVVTSKFMKRRVEIYFCDVAEGERNLGYGTALINRSVKNAFMNGVDASKQVVYILCEAK